MISPMDEYTEDDVRWLAGRLLAEHDQEFDSSHLSWQDFASAARGHLDAIAERWSGRLLPADARTEYGTFWDGICSRLFGDLDEAGEFLAEKQPLYPEHGEVRQRWVGSWVSVEPEQGRAEAGAYDQASPVTTTRPGPAEEAYGETTLIPSVPVVNEPPTEHFLDEHDRAAIGLYADEPDVEIAMQMLPAGAEAFGVEPDHVRAAEETFERGDDLDHDEWCEADMVIPGGWTPCRCAERAAELTEKGAEG